jgi:hypothetical protein
MTRALSNRAAATAFAVAAVWLACALIARSAAFARHPTALSSAITIDLTATAALAVWLAGARTRAIARAWLWRSAALGLIVARLILPPEHRDLLRMLRFAWAPIELAILALVVVRARRLVAHVRARRASGAGLHDALADGLGVVLGAPRLGAVLASEVLTLKYAFAGAAPPSAGRTFSYHARSQWRALAPVFAFLIVVESAALHLALARASPAAAWASTALGAYSIAWLVGDWRAMKAHPLVLDAGELRVEIGLRRRAVIPLALVESVDAPHGDERRDLDYVALGPDRAPSLVLRLRAPVEVRGPFGARRFARALGVGADAPDELAAALAGPTGKRPSSPSV